MGRYIWYDPLGSMDQTSGLIRMNPMNMPILLACMYDEMNPFDNRVSPMDQPPKDNHEPIRLIDDDENPSSQDQPEQSSETLFETYEPRSASTIVSQQRALQESEAAEAAGIILEGVEPPEFEFPLEQAPTDEYAQHGQLLSKNYDGIRVQKATPVEHLFSPGAQFIYALLIITALGGIIGLAATIESPTLVLIAGIASPILLPICVWKWHRWLDSSPYYYRLLTSLGEDARNLMGHRLFWKRSN